MNCAALNTTTALDRGIDERVHRLYGLTVEDIKMVEEASE